MAFYQFKRQQIIPASRQDVWDFIASPVNLKKITPPSMGFDILNPDLPDKMYEGMIIHYQVKPMKFYATRWVTEITHIQPGHYFVDEQRMGPYRMWHHQHWVTEHEQGALMTDIISYQPPLGWIGQLANAVLIKGRLQDIFNFREKAIREQWPSPLNIERGSGEAF
ncbi:SRPBCC family protein [Carboxylicivirga taeanensis]|uniref:SRPBCC family protein n=1 Tax=Carboxylicivirga taeanensis TaxID=1416875 RepID=UPI003F6DCEB0